jgi:hypothetical protein
LDRREGEVSPLNREASAKTEKWLFPVNNGDGQLKMLSCPSEASLPSTIVLLTTRSRRCTHFPLNWHTGHDLEENGDSEADANGWNYRP